ncbi:hypothetical protein R1sor_014116 [Riccia sorocarpa]|uniref:Uncharacterized protein n=1 Tax=Riccia sorocarpa TaxID=122646 RepID=A0ABD3HBH3_9MARC
MSEDRYPFLAYRLSSERGWFADINRWADSWSFPASEWGNGDNLRQQLTEKVVSRIWHNPSSRLLYYQRDIVRERTLVEQTSLWAMGIRVNTYIQTHGWQADLCRWSATLGLLDSQWEDEASIREQLMSIAVRKLWNQQTRRQQYYLRDIDTLLPYAEKSYLTADIPLIAPQPFDMEQLMSCMDIKLRSYVDTAEKKGNTGTARSFKGGATP